MDAGEQCASVPEKAAIRINTSNLPARKLQWGFGSILGRRQVIAGSLPPVLQSWQGAWDLQEGQKDGVLCVGSRTIVGVLILAYAVVPNWCCKSRVLKSVQAWLPFAGYFFCGCTFVFAVSVLNSETAKKKCWVVWKNKSQIITVGRQNGSVMDI